MSGDDDSAPRRARLVGSGSRRLVDELSASRRRRQFTPGGVVVYALASAVHAVTFGFLALGVWLLFAGDNGPQKFSGGLCLLVPLAMLPQMARVERGVDVLGPDAPETTALLTEVARLVDSPMPTRFLINEELNAFVSYTGLRGRVLSIGAPLWVACSPQARVALLAHELGHFANRDLIHGRYVGAAYHAVGAWLDIFTPGSMHEEVMLAHGLEGAAGGKFARIATWPVRALLGAYLWLMHIANATARRRQEHYADLASVRAGGMEGAVDLLETLLAVDGIVVTANRVAVTTGRPPLRPAIEDFMAGYGDDRRGEARRRGEAEASRIDDSHPPTIERLRLVESVERPHSFVTLDQARSEAIDRELAGALDRGLTAFADIFRG